MPGAQTVLVIDDDPILREIAHQILTTYGYAVVLAEDGEVGLRLAAESPPDLVITDLVMPNREGIEVIRELKASFPQMPVIAISAGTQTMAADPLLRMARAFGADETIVKPLREAALVALVRRLLEPSKN